MKKRECKTCSKYHLNYGCSYGHERAVECLKAPNYALWEPKERGAKMKTKPKVEINPTVEQSENLISAFDYLNENLFDSKLPRPMLLFTRNPKVLGGYFSDSKWFDANGSTVDEIALNANHLIEGDEIEIFGILIHEMSHQWQHHFGTSGRGGYHNREWADKVLEIGLKPINTKDPDAETGDSITTALTSGGRAMIALAKMPESITIPFYSEMMDAPSAPEDPKDGKGGGKDPGVPKPKSGSRTKYTCIVCGTNLWGKPGLNIMCLNDSRKFTETI